MRGRWVVLLLVLGLSGLRALASANLPDPVWVPGVYDGADYDDVFEAALSGNCLRDDSPPTLGRPAPLGGLTAVPSPACPPSAPRRSQNSRAPPAS